MFLNSELFSHQRGSSTIGYKKIKKGTMILSAQNLHLGNANVNLRFEHGMISPAYKTYNILDADTNFMAQWIKRDATNKMFFDATTTGASQCRRNVIWNELYQSKIKMPQIDEQKKIAHFFELIDEKIEVDKTLSRKYVEFKKALIQKMIP